MNICRFFFCTLFRFISFSWSTVTVFSSQWDLLYKEDFKATTLLDSSSSIPWILDDPYGVNKFDTIMDDGGIWYENDYGPAFNDALNSFHTYRKDITIGTDGWLTASFSARDWNKDGIIEEEPTLQITTLDDDGNTNVLTMEVKDHTGGIILRPTNALPEEYRVEYKLYMLDFGGKDLNNNIEYDGRINGYSKEGCKTQHPWGEGSKSKGWSGDATEPYCNWQDVREGVYGYNGFHFLSIVDFANPTPRNNHFWHYRRKVIMDSFSQHPDRVESDRKNNGGKVCNIKTGEYYPYKNSSFRTLNMWISGLPGTWKPNPGGLIGNSQRFITSCNGGVDSRGVQSAAELNILKPNQYYTFAIERNSTGYTLEASGNFSTGEETTLRFFRPFLGGESNDNQPIWHYNVKESEYDGRYNNDLIQRNWQYGSMVWKDQWPSGSAYPDYFVIGDLYTNVYEGKASLTDIRLYVPTSSSQNQNNDNDDNSNESVDDTNNNQDQIEEDQQEEDEEEIQEGDIGGQLNNQCIPVIFLARNERIDVDETVMRKDNLFLTQKSNGNLKLEQIMNNNNGASLLIWESKSFGLTPNDTYYTKLQGDGNLIIWRVYSSNDGDKKKPIWKSNSVQSDKDGLYFFAFDGCNSMVIYKKENTTDTTTILWKNDVLTVPTISSQPPSSISPTIAGDSDSTIPNISDEEITSSAQNLISLMLNNVQSIAILIVTIIIGLMFY